MFRYQINSSLKLKNSNRQPLVVNIKKCSKSMVTYCIEKGKSRRIKGHFPNCSDGWVLGCFRPKRCWWAHPYLHCAPGCVFWFFSEFPISPLKSKSGNHSLFPPCLRVKSLAACFGYTVLLLSPPLWEGAVLEFWSVVWQTQELAYSARRPFRGYLPSWAWICLKAKALLEVLNVLRAVIRK